MKSQPAFGFTWSSVSYSPPLGFQLSSWHALLVEDLKNFPFLLLWFNTLVFITSKLLETNIPADMNFYDKMVHRKDLGLLVLQTIFLKKRPLLEQTDLAKQLRGAPQVSLFSREPVGSSTAWPLTLSTPNCNVIPNSHQTDSSLSSSNRYLLQNTEWDVTL